MKKILLFFSFIFINISFAMETPVKEIKGSEVWSGDVIIEGIVAVRKGAYLKIMPGTKVMFIAKDYDGDDIGDGEVYVEGEIECLGTKDAPIIFTVYKDAVEPAKWKYVMVNHAKKAVFDWTIFEGAYSGLQVHFSTATVKNCVFRKNIDGFRFSTSNIFVSGCKMTENKHGIRYEERDSTGTICGNEITDNEIGIFPVTKCKGKINFKLNNIYQNGYNIRMGDEQRDDLSFANNYFGSQLEREILKTIYDRKFDKNLPKVKYKPFLKKAVLLGEEGCLER